MQNSGKDGALGFGSRETDVTSKKLLTKQFHRLRTQATSEFLLRRQVPLKNPGQSAYYPKRGTVANDPVAKLFAGGGSQNV
jgi:hypothetical protein